MIYNESRKTKEIEIKDPGELNNSLELKLQGQKRLESNLPSQVYMRFTLRNRFTLRDQNVKVRGNGHPNKTKS